MIVRLIQKNYQFIIGWLLFILLGLIYLYNFDKASSFITANPLHNTFLDYTFRIITTLGDGLFIVALGALLFILKAKRHSLLLLASFAVSGIIVQLIKNISPSPRPSLFLQQQHIDYPYFLAQITLHNFYSFPSGHTASAFTVAASLAFLLKNKSYSFIFLMMAILIGYSRIYLGQHFPEDVVAGSAIGVVSTMATMIMLDKFFPKWQQL